MTEENTQVEEQESVQIDIVGGNRFSSRHITAGNHSHKRTHSGGAHSKSVSQEFSSVFDNNKEFCNDWISEIILVYGFSPDSDSGSSKTYILLASQSAHKYAISYCSLLSNNQKSLTFHQDWSIK